MTTFDRHEYWRNPEYDAPRIHGCMPEFYLELENVTKLVVNCMNRYIPKDRSILEIGCGTGRNLVGLVKAGYTNVSGVEISENTVAVGRERFPEYRDIEVKVSPIEEIIEGLPKYDVIFTQGCLMHLPYSLDWIIEEIKRKARYLILTNEGEPRSEIHVWRRNYEEYITRGRYWMQLEMENGILYPPLPETTIKRVFIRRE